MALFKSAEEKQQIQAEKEQKILQKYKLDTLADPEDREQARKIISDLVGTGMMESGMKLSMTKAEDALPVYYLRAILEQNFIIIRQLDKLNKK